MSKKELTTAQTLELLNNANRVGNIGIFQVEVETKTVYWNDVLRSIYEVSKDFTPTIESVLQFITSQELKNQIKQTHLDAIKHGEAFELEHEILTAKGNIKYTQSFGKPIYKKNKCVFIQGTVLDLTKRKTAELELAKKNQQLLLSEQIVQLGYWRWDTIKNEETWSDNLYKIFDRKKGGKLTYETYMEYVHPEEIPLVVKKIENAFQNHILETFSHRIILQNGTIKTILLAGQVITNNNGDVIEMVGTCQDITANKAKENELKQKNQQQIISERMTMTGSWHWNPDTGSFNWSDNLYEILDIEKKKEIVFDFYITRTHPDDRALVSSMAQEIKKTNKPLKFSHRFITKRKTQKILEIEAEPIKNSSGKLISIIGTTQDITHKLQAEIKLSQTNKQLNLTERLNQAGSWQLDVVKDEFKWSDNLYKLLEFEVGSPMCFKLLSEHFHPDDKDFAIEEIQKVIKSKKARTFSHRFVLKNGDIKTLEIFAEPVATIKKNVTELVGTIRDITDNISLEHDLNEANELLHFAEQLSNMGYWRYKPDNNSVFWSDNLYRLFDVPKSEKLNFDSYYNKVHPNDQDFVKDKVKQSIHDQKFYDFTHRIIQNNGSIKTLQIIGKVTVNNADGKLELLGMLVDITESETKELELAQKNQQLRIAEEMTKIGNWQWNPVSNKVRWSDNLYAIYGHPKNVPVTYETYIDYIHEDYKAEIVSKLEASLIDGNFREAIYNIQLKNGTIKTLRSVGKIITNDHGDVIEMLGTCQDITEIQEKELELTQKNQKLSFAEQMAMIGSWHWILNTDQRVWSDNLYRIYGIPVGTALTRKLTNSHIHPDDFDYIQGLIKNRFATNEGEKIIYRIIRSDGEIRTLEILAEIRKNSEGLAIEIIGTTQDITESKRRELQIIEKNKQLNIAEEMAMLGSWEWSPKKNIYIWSENLYRIFGFKQGTSISRERALSKVHPQDVDQLNEKINAILNGAKLRHLSYRIIFSPKVIKTLEVRLDISFDENGDIYLQGITQDVSERILREQQLLQKNQQLNDAEVLAKVGSWSWHTHSNTYKFSDNLYKMYDIDIDTPLNFKTFLKSIHPEDREYISNIKKNIHDTIAIDHIIHRTKHKDGTVRIIEAIGKVVTNDQGKIIEIIGSSQDITERVQKENDLLAKNQMLNLAQELALIGYWQFDLATKTIEWSDNLALLYNFSPGEKVNSEKLITHIHPDDIQMVISSYKEYIRTKNFKKLSHRVIHLGGTIKTIEIVGTVITNKEGKVTSLIGSSRDITDDVSQKRELQKMNQQLKKAETLAMMGSFLYQHSNRAFVWSDNAYRIFGFEVGIPMNFETFLQCIHPDDYKNVTNHLQLIVNTKEFKSIIFRVKHKNGAIRMIESSGNVFTNEEGEILEILGTSRDVTERVLRETSLVEKNQMLNLTQELAKVGYWQLNLATSTIVWSDQIDIIYGFEKDEPKNYETLIKHIHPEDVGYTDNLKDQFKITKDFTKFTHRAIHKDGTIKIIEVVGTVISNKEGEAIEFLGSSRDITEEVEQKRELQQMNQQLNKAEHLAMIGSFLYCPKTEKFKWSDNSYRIYGFEVGIPMNFETFLTCVHPDDYDKVINHHIKILNTQKFTNLIYRINHKNGAVRIIEAIGTVILDKAGDIIEIIGTSRDITDQKKAEDKILETNNRLQENTIELKARNKQLADFNQITSHNLRAPVSNLNTLIELYNDAANAHLKAEFFNKFTTVVDHLTLTLNTLIDSLKIKNSKNQTLQELSFNDEMVKTKDVLSAQILKTKAIIRSDFSIVSKVKYHKIYLESIFLNLISNAIKYRSPDRIPEIYVHTYIENGKIIISFKDNGLGIDLKRHGHKLFGLNKVFHRHPEAQGIGLFLTKAQVEAMGGEIKVESEVNVGTTFLITLNIKKQR